MWASGNNAAASARIRVRRDAAEHLELIVLQASGVLFDPVLHRDAPMARLGDVPVHLPLQGVAPVPELAADRER